MEQINHMEAVGLRHRQPALPVGGVGARGASAGPGSHPVQDRAVERRVDNLVVGHVRPLSLSAPLFSRPTLGGYSAKPRNVQ